MDLRSCAAAIWVLASLLAVSLRPGPGEPAPAPCADEERIVAAPDPARGALLRLRCPGDEGGSPPGGGPGLLMGRRVDVNTATLEELQALPGIGPGLAARILSERERAGPFGSVDALRRVSGLGPSRIAALRGLATASGTGR